MAIRYEGRDAFDHYRGMLEKLPRGSVVSHYMTFPSTYPSDAELIAGLLGQGKPIASTFDAHPQYQAMVSGCVGRGVRLRRLLVADNQAHSQGLVGLWRDMYSIPMVLGEETRLADYHDSLRQLGRHSLLKPMVEVYQDKVTSGEPYGGIWEFVGPQDVFGAVNVPVAMYEAIYNGRKFEGGRIHVPPYRTADRAGEPSGLGGAELVGWALAWREIQVAAPPLEAGQ